MEAGLTASRTADDQHILVNVIFWYLIAPKHDSLCLCQKDIVIKLWVYERLYVLWGSP